MTAVDRLCGFAAMMSGKALSFRRRPKNYRRLRLTEEA